jgi:hypothetical protein
MHVVYHQHSMCGGVSLSSGQAMTVMKELRPDLLWRITVAHTCGTSLWRCHVVMDPRTDQSMRRAFAASGEARMSSRLIITL